MLLFVLPAEESESVERDKRKWLQYELCFSQTSCLRKHFLAAWMKKKAIHHRQDSYLSKHIHRQIFVDGIHDSHPFYWSFKKQKNRPNVEGVIEKDMWKEKIPEKDALAFNLKLPDFRQTIPLIH